MIRWMHLTALACSFLLATSFSGPIAAVAQTMPANPSSIQVFVSATAKDGTPVALDPSKLTVSIDKQPAQALSVRPAKDDKLLFAVMVDISSSQAPREKALKEAAVKIFQGLTNSQSQGYLVLFNQQAYPSKRPLQPAEAESALDHIQFNGGTALYDSIAQVSSGILSKIQNPEILHRVLVVITDGDDNYSHILFDKMEEAVERESISIFSLAGVSDGSDHGLAFLKQIAKDTGGETAIASKTADGVGAIIEAIQYQMELSVASVAAGGGKLHSLAVKANDKTVSVAAPAHILIP